MDSVARAGFFRTGSAAGPGWLANAANLYRGNARYEELAQISIIPDLVAPHEYEEDDKGGMLARGFRVDGLTSSSDISQQALEAQDNGAYIPAAGQPHPTLPDLVTRRVNIRPVTGSTTAIRIVIYYAKVRRRLLDVVLNGVSFNAISARDITGDLLVIGYAGSTPGGGGRDSADPALEFPLPPTKNNGFYYNYVKSVLPRPETTLEITYLENEDPEEKIGLYQGTLNSAPWHGGKKREWFCEAITARIESPIPRNLADMSNQQVVTEAAIFDWITTYRFRKRQLPPDGPGWDPLLIYVNQRTGYSPNDINPKAGGYLDKGPGSRGNGWIVPQMFAETDFNQLKLVTFKSP